MKLDMNQDDKTHEQGVKKTKKKLAEYETT